MRSRTLLVLLSVLVAAGTAAADTKVVKNQHTDGYTVMGQNQPPQDIVVTTWIGENRLQTDQPGSSFIVRLDQQVMYVVDHGERTYSVVKLPIDIDTIVPPEMAAAMKQMMTFTAAVTPADETEQILGRTARRYDMTMNSQMMEMRSQVWATTEVPFDLTTFRRMGEEVLRMQPGMAGVLSELRKIEGFNLRQTTSVRMTMAGNVEVRSREEVTSISDAAPPAGAYEPPADYTRRELDWQSMMRSGGGGR